MRFIMMALLIYVLVINVWYLKKSGSENHKKRFFRKLDSSLKEIEKNIFKYAVEDENPELINAAQEVQRSWALDFKNNYDKNFERMYNEYVKLKKLDLERIEKNLPGTERPEDKLFFEALLGNKSESKIRRRLSEAEEKRRSAMRYKISLLQDKMVRSRQ